jgi:hypothetical protein
MGRKDIRIVSRTRGILTKHFLELDELHVSCSRGVVRVLGEIQRAGPLKDIMPITNRLLHDLKPEIKRLPDVRRVVFSQKQEVEG